LGSTNPWVRSLEDSPQDLDADGGVLTLPRPAAALTPQPVVVQPVGSEPFARRMIDRCDVADLWWVGAHGGAGESTLEQLLDGSAAAGHAWPVMPDVDAPTPRAVLVARTHASGLRSAQQAATEWAAGLVDIDLVGLVLIADAPGRLPLVLRDFAHVVCGGVPRSWRLPWVQAWRAGEPLSADTVPRDVGRVLDDVRAAIASQTT